MGGPPERQDLTRWRAELRGNWATATPNMEQVLRLRAGNERTAAMLPWLRAFGATMAEVVEPAIAEVERHRVLPALDPYDGVGNPLAGVTFHADHRRAGRAVWASGLVAAAIGAPAGSGAAGSGAAGSGAAGSGAAGSGAAGSGAAGSGAAGSGAAGSGAAGSGAAGSGAAGSEHLPVGVPGGSGAFEAAALFYLLSHAGEGGHGCPMVCTVGLARALAHRGSAELRDRYLGRLVDPGYDRAWRGSQFLTEVQGGSDVGANTTRAVPDPQHPGAYRLTGEKWFCSVADADLFAVTARPDGAGPGTRGLGCFLVPRTLDGTEEPNGFRIRRLKDKLGTRALASAEIDFDGALGWPIGPVDEGFHVAVDELLNTSRWLNAVGSTGIMRRAVLEATSFARHRRAFGQPIGAFPIVREQLALMKVEELAALSSTMLLTGVIERIDAGDASTEERAVHRLLVNANKYVTSIAASDVVHRGIEVLGGNGTIEDFSPLPRLYRDAIVFESWEGTHNVLCAQVRRDCSRLGLLGPVVDRVRGELARAGEAAGAAVRDALARTEARIQEDLDRDRTPEDVAAGAAHFRRNLDRLTRTLQAASLLAEAAAAEAAGAGAAPAEAAAARAAADAKAAAASLFIRVHLVPGHDPQDDPQWSALVERALAGDAG
ncbi:MAG: acyl-CoA dehydrogenase family protein [Actinomycetota bacterium]|nr:acyl-CoA dehydrogenase family protein [Actinomycetota bacterium]